MAKKDVVYDATSIASAFSAARLVSFFSTILRIVSCESLFPLCALDIFARVSGLFFLPKAFSDIFARASGE